MRVGFKIVIRDGIADGVGRDHARIVLGMVLKIRPQQHQNHGRALAVACQNERAAAVAVFKVVVERGCDVRVGQAHKRIVKVPGLLDDFPRVPQAGLAIIRSKHIGGILVCGCVVPVFHLRAEEKLFVVERRVIGGALLKAGQNVIRGENVERVNVPGDLRKMLPAFLFGVVGGLAFFHGKKLLSIYPHPRPRAAGEQGERFRFYYRETPDKSPRTS